MRIRNTIHLLENEDQENIDNYLNKLFGQAWWKLLA